MICLKLNWIFYGLSHMFQLPRFVWALRSSVWDFFINFLLIDATDRSKISSDQKRFFIALSQYPLSFFANTPFKFRQVAYSTCSHNLWTGRTKALRNTRAQNLRKSIVMKPNIGNPVLWMGSGSFVDTDIFFSLFVFLFLNLNLQKYIDPGKETWEIMSTILS